MCFYKKFNNLAKKRFSFNEKTVGLFVVPVRSLLLTIDDVG